jgi:hypothetical protein
MEARDGIEPPRRSADPSFFVSGSAPSLTTSIASRVEEMRATILRVPFHKVSPAKRLDKRVLGESRLEESILASTGVTMDLE